MGWLGEVGFICDHAFYAMGIDGTIHMTIVVKSETVLQARRWAHY